MLSPSRWEHVLLAHWSSVWVVGPKVMAVPPSAALRFQSLRCGVWEEKSEMNRDLGVVNAMYDLIQILILTDRNDLLGKFAHK